jgi:hypothetical protein
MVDGFFGGTDRILDIGTPLKRLRIRPFFGHEIVTLLRTKFSQGPSAPSLLGVSAKRAPPDPLPAG